MTKTKVAERNDTENPDMVETGPSVAQVAESQGQVAVFQPPRLPWHPAIAERFPEVTRTSWKALVEAVYPAAKTVDAVVMALSYCQARNLDPFKKPVHIVPMWDSKSGGYIETVWPGISELRTTAFRTRQYAGCDETEFGPLIEHEFVGDVWVNRKPVERKVKLTFHEWARITIHRQLPGGGVGRWVGPKVMWIESYATLGKSDIPNDMWQNRSLGQLEKCAEAAALRKAFPEELGSQYAAEEMEGRRMLPDPVDAAKAIAAPVVGHASIGQAIAAANAEKAVEGSAEPVADGRPPKLDLGGDPAPAKNAGATAEIGNALLEPRGTPPGEAGEATGRPPPIDGEIIAPEPAVATGARSGLRVDEDFLGMVEYVLGKVNDGAEIENTFNDKIAPRMDEISRDRVADVYAIVRKHEIRLGVE